jgi:hypothetical protein
VGWSFIEFTQHTGGWPGPHPTGQPVLEASAGSARPDWSWEGVAADSQLIFQICPKCEICSDRRINSFNYKYSKDVRYEEYAEYGEYARYVRIILDRT